MNSFRLRLALLVGVLTVALLLAAGWISWELTGRLNLDRLDREMHQLAKNNLERVNDRSHWERLEGALAFVAGGDHSPPYVLWAKNGDHVEFRSRRWPGQLDPESLPAPTAYEDGASFDESLLLPPPPPPQSPPPRRGGPPPDRPALPFRVAPSLTLTADGSTWRVAITGNPHTVLVIAANLHELDRDLVRLRRRYLTVLPLVLIVVGAAAWWLASRALRPVAALTRAAESITARGLDRRIAAPAHDREFQRLVSVFNAMLDRLETGFHQARRFSADASHELKTPLALLQAELEQALRAAPAGSVEQQTFSSLLDEIHHLKAILEKLLLLSLADSGHLALERIPADLSAILANVIEDCAALAPELQIDPALAAAVTVSADPVLLEQALQNLADNARKYNRPDGCVRFTLVADTATATARITVGNTGPGISTEDRLRVFERFYRGDPARRRDRTSGAGLGLSLSREILRAHGGDLTLSPPSAYVPGDWTEFVATLPLAATADNLVHQTGRSSPVTQPT